MRTTPWACVYPWHGSGFPRLRSVSPAGPFRADAGMRRRVLLLEDRSRVFPRQAICRVRKESGGRDPGSRYGLASIVCGPFFRSLSFCPRFALSLFESAPRYRLPSVEIDAVIADSAQVAGAIAPRHSGSCPASWATSARRQAPARRPRSRVRRPVLTVGGPGTIRSCGVRWARPKLPSALENALRLRHDHEVDGRRHG